MPRRRLSERSSITEAVPPGSDLVAQQLALERDASPETCRPPAPCSHHRQAGSHEAEGPLPNHNKVAPPSSLSVQQAFSSPDTNEPELASPPVLLGTVLGDRALAGVDSFSAVSVDGKRASEDPIAYGSVSAPPPVPAQSSRRRRKKRRNQRNASDSRRGGWLFAKACRLIQRSVCPYMYSLSVASLSALMTAVSVSVSIAIMLCTVGVLSSTSGGSFGLRSETTVPWENSAMLRAVSISALKPLEDAIRGLDELQQFAMQHRETELVLDMISTGGQNELKRTQPSRIYAPTADASALLPLSPFVSKLASQFMPTISTPSTRAVRNDTTGYYDPPAITTYSKYSNVPQLSFGLEDGRYVQILSKRDDLSISALDAHVRAGAVSGNYDGTFPLHNISLDSATANTFIPIINATPTDVDNTTRRYYSHGSWKIGADESIVQISGSNQSILPVAAWLTSPYSVDAMSISAVFSRLRDLATPKKNTWSDLVAVRTSPWYASARSGLAPLQKSVFGLYGVGEANGDTTAYALTIVAPVYIRRTTLFDNVGDPADPVGGCQRSQVTYSSPAAGAKIESFINEQYVFVGVAATHVPIRGLTDQLISAVDSVWADKGGPVGQLFLLRRDVVWATSIQRQANGARVWPTYTVPSTPTVLTDEDGVALCSQIPNEHMTCMHTVHTFGHELLLQAYRTLPAIANPPPLPDPLGVTNLTWAVADRVREFMQSSSTTQLLSRNDMGEASRFTDSEGGAWDVSYAVVSQPSIGIRPFSVPQTAPFVLVLLAPADLPVTCKEVIGVNIVLLVVISIAILVVVVAAVTILSRIALSPLSSIATLMSLSAHLVDSSTESSSVDDELKKKLADRTLSRWAEVSAIQKAYWSMTEELQFLVAYIPEHLRDEVLAMRKAAQGLRAAPNSSQEDWQTAATGRREVTSECKSVVDRSEESLSGCVSPTTCGEGRERAFPQGGEDSTSAPARRGFNVLKGPAPTPSRLTKAVLQEASTADGKVSPRSICSELSVGGRGLAAHSIVSLGVVLENLEGDSTDGSAFTSTSTAGVIPNPLRPVFFIDSALIDREITVVHLNIIHFHLYAGTTHGTEIARQYEAFISFVHKEARRHGGMLESFSGDKIWVSFNASSKCDNGPVAAAYYAHTVTSAVNNAVIRKVTTKAKAFRHPIFTNEEQFEQYFKIAPYGITCGISTGRAFVGPLGNSSVKRHTIISNAMSEASALERQALRYPGCNALMGGDMIPAVEGYCQYLLVDASLLPGSDNKRRRVACLKGPMLARGKDRSVVAKLLPADYAPLEVNPYRTVNEAMNAFLEGQADVCRMLIGEAEVEVSVPPKGEIRMLKTWEREEWAACVRLVTRFLRLLLHDKVNGRSYRSQVGDSFCSPEHALCCYTFRRPE